MMDSPGLEDRQDRLEALLLLGVLAAAMFRLWGMSMSCGITRDESGLLWAIAGGGGEIYQRAIRFPQSVAYAWLTLGMQALFGNTVWLLRLPTLMTSVATLAGTWWFLSRRLGSSSALYGLLFMLASPVVTGNGNALRPYAFGIGFVVLSWFLMTRFLETFSKGWLVCWAIVGAVPAYFTVFFILAVFSQWLGALAWLSRTAVSRKRALLLLPAGLIVVVADGPLYGYLRDLSKNAALHSYVPPPVPGDLVMAMLPPGLGVALLLVLVGGLALRIARNGEPGATSNRAPDAGGRAWAHPVLLLGVVQAIVPMVFLFFISVVNWHVVVFHGRYFSAALVAQALVAGAFYSRLGSRAIRIPVAVALLLLSLPGFWQFGRLWPSRDLDFREAAVTAAKASAEYGVPVFGVGVLTEACTYSYPLSEEDGKSILYVYHYYGANVQPMARPEAPGGEAALRKFIETYAGGGRSFLLIDHSIQPMEPLRHALMARFRQRLLWSGNGVRLELWRPRTGQ